MTESEFAGERTWPAKIAQEKDWRVGDILVAVEEGRYNQYFQITAIGEQLVLGRRMGVSIHQGRRGREFPLRLDDGLVEWSQSEWRGEYVSEEDQQKEKPKKKRAKSKNLSD